MVHKLLTAALVLTLCLSAVGCGSGTAQNYGGMGTNAASQDWTKTQENESRGPIDDTSNTAYHADDDGRVDGFGSDGGTPGQDLNNAGRDIAQAGEDAWNGAKDVGEDLARGAENAGRAIGNAAEDTGNAVKDAAESVKQDPKNNTP